MAKKKDGKKGIGRRDFLKTGALVVGTGAVASTGILSMGVKPAEAADKKAPSPWRNCNVNMDRVKPIGPIKEPKKYDYKTDVLVIGFGVGGTMAALQAVKQGAKIVVFEKLPRDKWDEHCGVHVLGGLGGEEWGRITGKGWNPAIDVEAAAYEIWAAQDYQADFNLIKKQVEEWPAPIEALRSIGLKFLPVDLGDSFVGRMKIEYPAIRYTNVGNDVQDFTPMDPWVYKYHACELAIERWLLDSGKAKLIYGADDTRLIANKAGRVVGAKTMVDCKPVYVNAKTTVIATGGYGANYDMIKYYGWLDVVCGCHVGSDSNDGHGIRMGQGLGADLSCMPSGAVADGGPDTLEVGRPWTFRNNYFYKDKTVSGYTEASIQLARQPALRVNLMGLRFMDENETWKAKNLCASEQPGKVYFTIFDGDIDGFIDFTKKSRYGMCENMITPDFRVFFEDEDIRPLWHWRDSLEWCKKNLKNVFEANSIEELAKKAGINPKNFVEQVKRYNEFCRAGVDKEFGKHKSFLYPVEKPPFIAIKTKPSFLWSTVSGLRINTKWQIVKPNGEPIPGLYGGSNDVGGFCKPYGYGNENEFQPATTAVINGSIGGRNAALEALGKA
ncbi:MAG: FAD-binding protein [Desulfomonilia bacterium]